MIVSSRMLQAFFFGALTTTLACSGSGDGDGDGDDPAGGFDDPAETDDPKVEEVALPDPCTLITAAEIESLLGEPIEGELQDANTAGGEVRRCSWRRKYSPELRTDTIVLSIAGASSYASEGSTALIGASPYDIGDEGQLLDQNRGVQIAWKKGALSGLYRYSLIGGFEGDFEELRVRAKELAQAANGRM